MCSCFTLSLLFICMCGLVCVCLHTLKNNYYIYFDLGFCCFHPKVIFLICDIYIFFISNTCHMLVMFLYFYLQLNRTGSWKMTSILNWRVFTLPRVKGGGLHFLNFTPQQTDSCCKFSIYSRADRCCYLHWLCQNIVQTWLTTHFLWFFVSVCVYV